MRIVLMGGPGSGKATQAKRLSAHYCVPLVLVTELVKDASRQAGESGLKLRELIGLGQQPTDELILLILKERLLQLEPGSGFLLVDYPRTFDQAQILDQALQGSGLNIDLVVQLVGDEDHFMERLEGREACSVCGATYNAYSSPPRVDGVCDLCGGRIRRYTGQSREAISSRMRLYSHHSALLEPYYRQSGRLIQVSGDGEVEAVFRGICESIGQLPLKGGSASGNTGTGVMAGAIENGANGMPVGSRNPPSVDKTTQKKRPTPRRLEGGGDQEARGRRAAPSTAAEKRRLKSEVNKKQSAKASRATGRGLPGGKVDAEGESRKTATAGKTPSRRPSMKKGGDGKRPLQTVKQIAEKKQSAANGKRLATGRKTS